MSRATVDRILDGSSPGGPRSAGWARSLRAAQQFRDREGHLTVPRTHIETIVDDGQEYPIKLGVWLSNQRRRRAKLTPDRVAALEALGAL